MSRSAVLVVTNEQDIGADYLVRELGRRNVPVVRLNAERGPEWGLSLYPPAGWRIHRGQRDLSSDDCVGVWWRRPEAPARPDLPAAAEAISDQWLAFLRALATVPGPVWVSEPDRIRAAEGKALQLRLAEETGLQVPQTLWTNDADDAKTFIERWDGSAVVKSLTTAWWENTDGHRFVFASTVGVDQLPAAGRLAQAPVCFQRLIQPKRDIRVTVVGGSVFGAIRDVPQEDGEPLDWRLAPQHAWSAYELPADIADRCRELVRKLGLCFSGIDLALDEQQQHWFLELNPNGEWGWLQAAGIPIAEAIADTLLAVKPSPSLNWWQRVLVNEHVGWVLPTRPRATTTASRSSLPSKCPTYPTPTGLVSSSIPS